MIHWLHRLATFVCICSTNYMHLYHIDNIFYFCDPIIIIIFDIKIKISIISNYVVIL